MRACYKYILVAVLAVGVIRSPVSAGADSGKAVEVLTIDDAVSIAEANNRLLKNAEIEIGKAQNEVEVTKTKRLPDLLMTAEGSQLLSPVRFEFDKGSLGTYPDVGPIPSVDTAISAKENFSVIANATLLQPITQLYRINLGVRMQKDGVEIARESWRSQKHALICNVKQLYYGLAGLASAKKTVGESIAFLTELERFVSDNVKQGTTLESDLLEVQARLARQKHQDFSLDSAIANTKEKLNVALGRDVSKDFSITSVSVAAAPTKSLAELQDYAGKHRPEVRQSSLKVRIARNDERSKRSEGGPEFSVGFTYTRFQNIEVIPDQLLTAGVVATWNEPFDWGRRKQERAEKAKNVQEAANGLEEARAEVTVDVDAGYRDLIDAISLLDADSAAVRAKEEKRRVAMNRYKENAALLKDVLESDTELADANRQYLDDQLAVSTAGAKLDQAIGED
jgi:outer membrane protein TolC